MLCRMKKAQSRFVFTLVIIMAGTLSTRISLAQAPTETDERITTLSNRIEKRATKEELGVLQTQLAELHGRVDRIEEKTSNTATEMRVAEVIGAGAAFVIGIFVNKLIGQLMPDKK